MGGIGLRDTEKVDFDNNGVDQQEMGEWTDVETEFARNEHMVTITHGASPKTIDARAVERRFIERCKPLFGGLCVPQRVLAGKGNVELRWENCWL